MAKWNITPGTINNTLSSKVEYGDSVGDINWSVYQNETPFIDEAKRNRDEGTKKTHMNHKKFATIPDIVAIEIAEKYGIDIHDPTVMDDRHRMAKFKQIVMRDYAYLVVNKA